MPEDDGYRPQPQCKGCGMSVVEGKDRCPNCGTPYSAATAGNPPSSDPEERLKTSSGKQEGLTSSSVKEMEPEKLKDNLEEIEEIKEEELPELEEVDEIKEVKDIEGIEELKDIDEIEELKDEAEPKDIEELKEAGLSKEDVKEEKDDKEREDKEKKEEKAEEKPAEKLSEAGKDKIEEESEEIEELEEISEEEGEEEKKEDVKEGKKEREEEKIIDEEKETEKKETAVEDVKEQSKTEAKTSASVPPPPSIPSPSKPEEKPDEKQVPPKVVESKTPEVRRPVSVPAGPVEVKQVKGAEPATMQKPSPPAGSPPIFTAPVPPVKPPSPTPQPMPTEPEEAMLEREKLMYISFGGVAGSLILLFLLHIVSLPFYILRENPILRYATYGDLFLLVLSFVFFILLVRKYLQGKRFMSSHESSTGTRIILADIGILCIAFLTITAAGFSDATWMLESPYPILIAAPLFMLFAYLIAQFVKSKERIGGFFIYTTGMFILILSFAVMFLNIFNFKGQEIPALSQFVAAVAGIHLIGGIAVVAGIKNKQKEYKEYINLGVSYFEQGRHDMAIIMFDKAAIRAHEIYSHMLPESGEYSSSGRQPAYLPPPEYIRPWYLKAQSLMMMKLYKKAIAHFEIVLLLDSQNPKVWNAKGEALLNLDRREEAKECFKTALRLKPDFKEAEENLKKAEAVSAPEAKGKAS